MARLMLFNSSMSLSPQQPWVRALMWLVIICVPGGLVLFAFLAADAVHRRLDKGVATAETDASEPGVPDSMRRVDQRA